jgi:hypothetical protein
MYTFAATKIVSLTSKRQQNHGKEIQPKEKNSKEYEPGSGVQL